MCVKQLGLRLKNRVSSMWDFFPPTKALSQVSLGFSVHCQRYNMPAQGEMQIPVFLGEASRTLDQGKSLELRSTYWEQMSLPASSSFMFFHCCEEKMCCFYLNFEMLERLNAAQ